MKPYVLSLLAGILAGAIYGVIGVHSPAPPTIALLGLLGMLAGEQILPLARRMMEGNKTQRCVARGEMQPAHVRPAAGRQAP